MIELGDRVKDKISGVQGVAIGVTFWLHGCKRWVIQPEKSKDGKPAESISVDEPQIQIVKKAVAVATGLSPPPEPAAPPPRRHGPMPEPRPASHVGR